MRSDTVIIKSGGSGVEEALKQAEATALYKGLDKKDALHLRLLTEETAGMLRAMAGNVEAEFWIEDKNRDFELHLKARAEMNSKMRKELLSVSTSGKNEAAKGFMGKIRQLFETAAEPLDDTMPSSFAAGWITAGAASGYMPAMGEIQAEVWSLNQYKSELSAKKTEKEKEAWDELEKSVVSKLADDVKITISKGVIELVICKKFA